MSLRTYLGALFLALAALAHGQGGLVKEIDVNGNKSLSREAILAAMETKVGQPLIRERLVADKATLESRGFFEAVDIEAKPFDLDWKVIVNVIEFPVIKEIRVTGNRAISSDEILKVITLKPGDVYNLNARGPSRKAIADLYTRKGFFADVASMQPLEDSPGTMSVQVVEATVDSVKVTGNKTTKPEVFNRLIRTKSGEPYNINKWSSDLRRLDATGWFDRIDPHETQVDFNKVALSADVKEPKHGRFEAGVSADPSKSLDGYLKVQEPDFNGTGQSIGMELSQATTGGGLSADLNYTNPFLDSLNTGMSFSVYSHLIYRFTGTQFGSNQTPTNSSRYDERRSGAALGFSREFRQDTVASISFRGENVNTNNLSVGSKPGKQTFIQQDGSIGSVTLGLLRNTKDTNTDPSRGDWLNVQLEPGYSNISKVAGSFPDKSILGPNYYAKSTVEYQRYWSAEPSRGQDLDAPRHVLAFRMLYGTINGQSPFFEQYFVGGSDTLRGYQDDRFWGRSEALTSLEYRNPIQKSMSLIGFLDYGGAWGGYGSVNDFTQSDTFRMHPGYGLGLGFNVKKLGPIRIDLGFDENGKSRTDFRIGSSF
jgi:outer membrane protein insertion porin family